MDSLINKSHFVQYKRDFQEHLIEFIIWAEQFTWRKDYFSHWIKLSQCITSKLKIMTWIPNSILDQITQCVFRVIRPNFNLCMQNIFSVAVTLVLLFQIVSWDAKIMVLVISACAGYMTDASSSWDTPEISRVNCRL